MSDDQALHVELITRLEAIPLTPDEWNALVAANETNTIFQTWEWFEAWWRTFGSSRRLFLLIVRRGQEIIGFAALARRRSTFGWRRLEFAGTGNADYQDFVLPTDKPLAVAAICAFLRAHWWRWDRLALANVPGHSSTLAHLEAGCSNAGLRVVDESRVSCPTLLLQEDHGRARNVIEKYSVRRPHNWFSKRGDVRFRHVTSSEEIERLLPLFFDQHRRRWQAVGKASLFNHSAQMRFYETLARTMLKRGWLQFSVVEFNGDSIAFHFGFDYFGCVTWYKPTFEVRYAEHSPGLLLTRHLILDGLHRSRRELDFTCGDESFKERFASRHRFNANVGVYHSVVLHGLAVAVRNTRRLAGRAMRRMKAWRARSAPAGVGGVAQSDSGLA
jgi:CelD/BcsL family acetyltransferase involved in cellulose biosynthesis